MQTKGLLQSDHHLIEVKHTSEALSRFQAELLRHPDIMMIAQKGVDFAESMALIGKCLGIELDGAFDPEDLFKLFAKHLRERRPPQ
jgi:hypothetical protein